MSEREISPLEDKLLGQAVAATESEIFRSAMDQADPVDADETDRSVEEMGEGLEGQHEAEVAEEGDEAETDGEEDGDDKADGDQEADRDDKGRFKATEQPKPGKTEGEDKGHMIPRSRLTEEANKRREIEDARKADQERHNSEVAALNRRLDEILARSQQPPQPVQVAPKTEPAAQKPDMFTDPEGYEKWVLEQARSNASQEMGKVVTERFVSASMADAHETHGDEFVKAYENLTGINPVTSQVVRQIDRTDPVRMGEIQRVINAPNPGRALMNWQRQQATLQRVGADPAKFEESIRAAEAERLRADPAFRKELLDSLRAEAAQGDGRPRTTTRFPKSLTDVSGGQSAQSRDPAASDNSEEGIFEGVWSDRKAG